MTKDEHEEIRKYCRDNDKRIEALEKWKKEEKILGDAMKIDIHNNIPKLIEAVKKELGINEINKQLLELKNDLEEHYNRLEHHSSFYPRFNRIEKGLLELGNYIYEARLGDDYKLMKILERLSGETSGGAETREESSDNYKGSTQTDSKPDEPIASSASHTVEVERADLEWIFRWGSNNPPNRACWDDYNKKRRQLKKKYLEEQK